MMKFGMTLQQRLTRPNWLARFVAVGVVLGATMQSARAHVSEQGLILLLPTGVYITSGVAAVALTVLLVVFLPDRQALLVFSKKVLFTVRPSNLHSWTSLVAFVFLASLVYLGFNGTRDPLTNPLPLFIWTVWWVGFVFAQGVFGDLWRWLNPWAGFYDLLNRSVGMEPLFVMPEKFDVWPALVPLFAFVVFTLADLSPDDPSRLAAFVTGYWLYTFIGMLMFGGEIWLSRGECFTVLLRLYARLAPFSIKDGKLCVGTPGWRLVETSKVSVGGGVFVLMVLASGSFDGLNETFWWLAKIGINPLEFPGRSAVVIPTIAGLAVANLALPLIFAATVYAGMVLAGQRENLAHTFSRLSLAVLPIALAYHFSHYLTVIMVNGQYALAAASDPFASGADYLGLGVFYVTTGFLNTSDTVKVIWLSQAGAVVIGHIIAVMMSHAIALKIFGNARKAALSQLPTAVFMVAYTLFGLWLLASPRGL